MHMPESLKVIDPLHFFFLPLKKHKQKTNQKKKKTEPKDALIGKADVMG